VTIQFDNSTIAFTANNVSYTLNVPNARITFDPTATVATTTFNSGTNTWETITPPNVAGNTFLDALAFQVPVNFAGGINPVTWSGTFSSDTPAVKINWQWAAAVYTSFSTNYNALGVKPVDDNQASTYKNSDHAGTPESYKSFVTGGARGGGGSNFTGSYSGTGSVQCPQASAFVPQLADRLGEGAACAGMPPALERRLAAARVLALRMASATGDRQVRRLERKLRRKLAVIARLAARADRKGTIPPECSLMVAAVLGSQ
jgi:hypothetical protein